MHHVLPPGDKKGEGKDTRRSGFFGLINHHLPGSLGDPLGLRRGKKKRKKGERRKGTQRSKLVRAGRRKLVAVFISACRAWLSARRRLCPENGVEEEEKKKEGEGRKRPLEEYPYALGRLRTISSTMSVLFVEAERGRGGGGRKKKRGMSRSTRGPAQRRHSTWHNLLD